MDLWYRRISWLPSVLQISFGHFIKSLHIHLLKSLAFGHRQQSRRQAALLQKHLAEQLIKIDYVEPVLVYAHRDNIKQTDNDRVEVLGIKDVVTYFNKNMPARNKIKLGENDINKIIQIFIHK